MELRIGNLREKRIATMQAGRPDAHRYSRARGDSMHTVKQICEKFPYVSGAHSHNGVKQLHRNFFEACQVVALGARSWCPPSIPLACRAMSISSPGDDLPPSSW